MNRRLSLTKNIKLGDSISAANFNSPRPVRKVYYNIPKDVMIVYKQKIEKLGKEYEEKNFKPNVVYKLPGTSYINKKLEIRVVEGEPEEIWFNGEKLGSCTTNTDSEKLSRKYVPSFDDGYKNYIIKTSLISDGFIGGRTWEAFSLEGALIQDLTDYDNWKN